MRFQKWSDFMPRHLVRKLFWFIIPAINLVTIGCDEIEDSVVVFGFVWIKEDSVWDKGLVSGWLGLGSRTIGEVWFILCSVVGIVVGSGMLAICADGGMFGEFWILMPLYGWSKVGMFSWECMVEVDVGH